MLKSSFVLIFFFLAANLLAQEKSTTPEDEFGINFKGFVKTDIMIDSRQTVSAREGHLLLYPQPEVLDANNEDINDKANLNMLSIQTRLTVSATGPRAFGAKTAAVVEGAFFGHSDGDINGLRLRHAFLKLAWENSTLIVGQYWHPMFITDVFPGVISFNTGMPFQPFSRNPQIRFIQQIQTLELTLTAASQRDFSSMGPAGTSSIYLRNSVIPILDLNLKHKTQNFVVGAGINYKALTPRLITLNNYKTDKTINAISTMGFAKFVLDDFILKLEAVYGQNNTDLLMLGGYAVKSTDIITGIEEYTAIKVFSAWTDLSFGKTVNFGLFAGITKNLGSDDAITGAVYARGANIESVFRVSPRVSYKTGNTQFAGEIEYTSAKYGTPDNFGKVNNTTDVSNLRLLLAAYLYF